MDTVSSKKRSEMMAKVRSKNTTLETLVFRALRKEKIYFQRHYRLVRGTPDIAVPSKKLAVFIDSDFWHGWRFPTWRDKLTPFWKNKIGENIARDRRTYAALRRHGWKIIRVWGHQIMNDEAAVLRRIARFLRGNAGR